MRRDQVRDRRRILCTSSLVHKSLLIVVRYVTLTVSSLFLYGARGIALFSLLHSF